MEMRFAIVGICSVVLSGCYNRLELTSPAPVNQAMLIQYDRPTQVRLIVPGDDTGRMVLLRELRGVSQSVSGDTIRVAVWRGRDAEWAPVPGASIAIVVPAPGTRIETLHYSAKKAINIGVAIVAVVGLTYWAWAIISIFFGYQT